MIKFRLLQINSNHRISLKLPQKCVQHTILPTEYKVAYWIQTSLNFEFLVQYTYTCTDGLLHDIVLLVLQLLLYACPKCACMNTNSCVGVKVITFTLNLSTSTTWSYNNVNILLLWLLTESMQTMEVFNVQLHTVCMHCVWNFSCIWNEFTNSF